MQPSDPRRAAFERFRDRLRHGLQAGRSEFIFTLQDLKPAFGADAPIAVLIARLGHVFKITVPAPDSRGQTIRLVCREAIGPTLTLLQSPPERNP